MDILRTPDERFANLPGYPFAPQYVEVDGLRMHYVDEGPLEADPVLLLHGQPSWSYLYRTMIPIIAAGHRVIAPDLVGFGSSDKPVNREDYTYQRHVDWMRGLLEALNLRGITLVGQDWGGFIGLRLATEEEERFACIVAANTDLRTGDIPPQPGFLAWRRFSQETPVFSAGEILDTMMTAKGIPLEVQAAYNAPFPDEQYQAGARQFPLLVPTSPDDPATIPNRAAWEVLLRWEKPFLTAFSDADQAFRGADLVFQQVVPGAKGQPHVTIHGAGHSLQEDAGPELAQAIVYFLAHTS